MEPCGAVEDGLPVEVAGLDLGDRRMGTVIDDLRGTHAGALLRVVDADAASASADILRVDAETSELAHRGVGYRVVGQSRNKNRLFAVIGERDGDEAEP